jgi:diguanylate cyclase (GGDEF)-like protein
MKSFLQILHLEDNPVDAELVRSKLADDRLDCEIVRVDRQADFLAALDRGGFDLILCDYSIPSFDGLSALAVARQKYPHIPFIFLSGTIGEDRAIEALKSGATDYVLKDRSARLVPAIHRALREVGERAHRARAESEVQRLAYCDALTGLGNRVRLQDRLQDALQGAVAGNGHISLLLMDLDRFKEINDTLGHHNGDQVLQEVARRLSAALPEALEIARLGGDEFAVILRTDLKNAIYDVTRVLESLHQPIEAGGLMLDVKGSIGIAGSPDHGQDPLTLIQRADVAMYAAKARDSGYAFYAPEQDQYSPQRLGLMAELRQAIEDGHLLLHYQPKFSLKTGKIIGVEALVRWQHPERGLITPFEFLPLLEQTPLIRGLTDWVLEAALEQSRRWEAAGIDLPIAVNLSVRILQDVAFPEHVAELLRSRQVPPQTLCFEITESAIMIDPAGALTRLTRLHQMGVRLAIDDFGIGHSSMAYLKRLPVHELKIDKAFVIGLINDRKDAAIVRAAVGLAHDLGLVVVAEGVEDLQTQHGLMALGCDAIQGYFLSPPVSSKDLLPILGTTLANRP